MKNTTTSNSATCFMAYPQVHGREKMKGLFCFLLFFSLFTIATARVSAADQKQVSQPEETVMEQAPQEPVANAASPDSLYHLNQYSINAAGAIDDSSANYKLGLSLGQPIVGTASSASYQTGTGFWGEPCLFNCGDANGDGQINVGDAVFLINYVFKGGSAPDPLEAGDANCDGDVNVGDAVYLIAYVFKGGPEPCCP